LMGSSKQSTTSSQSQSGTIDPYAPSQGALQGILGGINSILPNYAPNAAQQSALSQIQNNAQNTPNYAPQAENLANSLMSGGPNYQPGVTNAYNQYQGAVSPLMSGSLDPMQTPGLSDALATIRNDVGNSVNGMFAGAGRDMSGLNQQALARGIAQGEAPVIVGQYNQNVANRLNAANGLLGGAQSTATTNSGLQQTQYGNQMAGVTNGASMVNNAANAAPNAQLAAAAQAYGIPIQNLAQLEALTVPIAGLGKQYTGQANSQSDTTSSPSMLQSIMGIGGLFSGGANSAASGAAGAGLGLLSMFSDPDLKTDAQEVGKLNDGQKIYSYRYKGDPVTRIGLMADEVEKAVPEAVGVLGGYRTVNYKVATDRAARGGK
jgi:hypothetical protein